MLLNEMKKQQQVIEAQQREICRADNATRTDRGAARRHAAVNAT